MLVQTEIMGITVRTIFLNSWRESIAMGAIKVMMVVGGKGCGGSLDVESTWRTLAFLTSSWRLGEQYLRSRGMTNR